MHEFSIAQELVSQLKWLLASHQKNFVTCIKLSIGEFSGVVPDSLLFSLKILAEQEPSLMGMKVNVQRSTVVYTCSRCGHNFHEKDAFHGNNLGMFQGVSMPCPLCGNEFCTHRGGDELLLLTVEME